ncbi:MULTISPECIES: molecular chaperone HtpG [Kandleria]|jgi:molecular chaperone HtpG|uniref:Chaperone protein HtpG n=2 Tax=Kandleria vitulina TaxID=1630 RepID=A0A0R2HPI6_9FIRM|nr:MULTISPECIES: molecular chaperone HtpG [Kandleria]KRN51325.1 heat shock protein 90 [Kandleria vitulina DSM 20405]MBP3277240.1 molecular chaperone HtpG [Kandleria sp.]MEE0989306.1 molecular chaperone HtpG [Kandleria vitulina]SDL57633.1 molecular chaperone HtpG [Kandleria vitulina]SDV99728.1 molecular chaperone HtpG [Kandleria vitulina]
MSEKKQFKTESKRLLDLMINSIYTHKEIFLRELVSNASDASDKLYYKALQENINGISREDMDIFLSIDKEKRTITIEDHGIGMDHDELEERLGTIANSGSNEFKNALEKGVDNVDIIGQFGVGFYSAFMVADKVEVFSKKYGEDKAYAWVSDTSDGYEIFESGLDHHGTKIVLHLKDNTEEENYDEYLSQYEIERLIKKYSDYIHYPIKMEMTVSKKKEDSDEYEDVTEVKVLNSQVPLWKRNKKDITEEEYNDFYKSKFNDFTDPQRVMHNRVEGNITYDSLLFIPSQVPMNYFSSEYEKGLQLYSRGVFIMDKAKDLVPEHFRFVRGLVDSQDLNLNISREMLQHDRSMKLIADRIEKRIQRELEDMLKKDREEYVKFWKNFGMQIKFGIYHSYGMLKDKLQDLLLFYSANKKDYITLNEYVEAMKEDQKDIYFASGETVEKIDMLPACEAVKDKGFDILYLTDNVDEFCLQMLRDYKEKTFKNVTQGDLNLESEEEKKELEQKTTDHKDLLDAIKEALGDKVVEVRLSSRLKSHPVCLTSSEGVSFEMEKVLNAMPEAQGQNVKAGRILEINPNHDLFNALVNVNEKNADKVKDYASLLFDEAMLIEGFTIEDPVGFSNKITSLMIEASK